MHFVKGSIIDLPGHNHPMFSSKKSMFNDCFLICSGIMTFRAEQECIYFYLHCSIGCINQSYTKQEFITYCHTNVLSIMLEADSTVRCGNSHEASS